MYPLCRAYEQVKLCHADAARMAPGVAEAVKSRVQRCDTAHLCLVKPLHRRFSRIAAPTCAEGAAGWFGMRKKPTHDVEARNRKQPLIIFRFGELRLPAVQGTTS